MQITVKVENLAVSVAANNASSKSETKINSKHGGNSKELQNGAKSASVSVSMPVSVSSSSSSSADSDSEERSSCKTEQQHHHHEMSQKNGHLDTQDHGQNDNNHPATGSGQRLLLDGICAYVKPGQIMAVMGASGCGKTTFLSALSGRRNASAGCLLFNGNQINKSLRRQICYVLQNDVFFANLTLRQTLEYTALLRLSDSMGRDEKMRKVDEIIEALDLRSCEQTLVGDFSTPGLSGGQKKRLSIACELLSNPAVMLLDEPTSSLDSCTALNLMKLLKQYAQREQKTIILSIHQPSSQIFYMFDKLLLLSRGQMLYFGSPQQALPFFNHFNYQLEHLSYNPADFLLEISKQMSEKELAKISLAARSTFFATHKTTNRSLTSGCQSVKSTGSTLSCGSLSRIHSPLSQHGRLQHHNQQNNHEINSANNNNSSKHNNTQITHQFVDPPSPSPPSQAVSIMDPNHPHHHHHHLHHDDHHQHGYHHHHHHHHHDERSTTRLNLNFESPSIHGSMSKIYTHEDHHFDCGSSTEGDDDFRIENNANQSWHRKHEWPSSFMTQVCALTSRNFIECRGRTLSKLNWIQTIGMALISGAMWFQLARTEESLEDVKGWIYFSTTYWMMFSLFSTLATIPQESQVISKERLGGYYRLSAYYVAKMIAELPLIVALPSVYHLISYPMLGLYSLQTFFAMWLMVILNSIAAQSVGILIGYSFKRIDISLTVASLYSTSTMLFAGFYAKNIPQCLTWYRFLSLIYYGFLNMQLVEFATGPPIASHELASHATTSSSPQTTGGMIPNSQESGGSILKPFSALARADNSSRTQFVDPGEVLWGLDRFRPTEAPTPFWFNTLCLLIFLLVFRVLGYFVLRSYHKPS